MLRTTKQLFKNLSITTCSLIFIILICEIVLQQTMYGKFDRFFNIIIPKDYMHASWYWNLPNEIDDGDEIEINEKIVPVKKDGPRILFVGDSGTRGVGVPIEDNFASLVSNELTKKNSKLTVINSGVPGMYPLFELDFFKNTMVKFKPDVVVMGLFVSNDITFNLHEDVYKDKGFRHLVGDYLRKKSALLNFLSLKMVMINVKYHLYDNNHISNLMKKLDHTLPRDEDGLFLNNYVHGEFAIYKKKYSSLTKRSFAKLKEIFAEFQYLGKKHGFRFAVALIPSLSSIQDSFDIPWTHDDKDPNNFYRFKTIDEIMEMEGIKDFRKIPVDFEKPHRLVRKMCRELNISCIDPLVHIKKSIGTQALNVDVNDDHLSKAGHKLLAKLLTEEILRWNERSLNLSP